MLVMDISCQHLGDAYKLEGFLVPFSTGWGNIYFGILCFRKYILVEYICWYWIYHANTWGWGNIYLGIVC